MLIINIGLFALRLLMQDVSAENETIDGLYLKFHQHDYNLQVEWAEVVSFKQPEVYDLKVNIFKFNRTCPAINATIGFNIDIGNDLEVIIQAYKFSSNEYRHFPLRGQFNFCKAMRVNAIGISTTKNCGNFRGCPIQKGRIYICNWTPDQSQFPPFIPTGRYMLEIQGVYQAKEIYILRGYAAVSRSIV